MTKLIGKNYPLFFDKLEEIFDLLTIDKIRDTYNYLINIDKSEYPFENFINDFF